MKLLFIEASPRGDESHSSRAAQVFVQALGGAQVDHLNVWQEPLPEFSGAPLEAKYAVMSRGELTTAQADAWSSIESMVERFKAADAYLFSVPMWNYGIPYKLKQYIDLITHPGLTFLPGKNGVEGLAKGPAVIVYARGGNYPEKDGKPDPFNLQTPYMKAWLNLVGVDPVHEFAVQQTLGPNAASEFDTAAAGLRNLAADMQG